MLYCGTARARKTTAFPPAQGISVRNSVAVGHYRVCFYHKSISPLKGKCLNTVSHTAVQKKARTDDNELSQKQKIWAGRSKPRLTSVIPTARRGCLGP